MVTTAGPVAYEGVGTIALLDALGARGLDMRQAATWLAAIRDVVGKMRDLLTDTAIKTPRGPVEVQLPAPVLRVFGDSLVLLWAHPANPQHALLMASYCTQQLVVGCLAHRIPVRGAVAFGEIVWDEETALGPAVSDAARWYESADWLGVIAAPSCAAEMDRFMYQFGSEWVSNWYMHYPVPMKCGALDGGQFWALSWPQELRVFALGAGRQWQNVFQDWLSRIPRGAEHEHKYAAATAFFNHYMDNWATHSARIIEAEGSVRG